MLGNSFTGKGLLELLLWILIWSKGAALPLPNLRGTAVGLRMTALSGYAAERGRAPLCPLPYLQITVSLWAFTKSLPSSPLLLFVFDFSE